MTKECTQFFPATLDLNTLENLEFLHRESVKDEELNSLNFRCDEFKKDHKGLHIVFSGCSVTYGQGLLQEEIWARQVYNKISQEIPCSGYFNLGITGTSIFDEIVNLFKYFKKYGNPDAIFILLPDILRFYSEDKIKNLIYNCNCPPKDFKLLAFLSNQYYLMLDSYCKSNNIQLYTMTWVMDHQEKSSVEAFYPEYFDTFYAINQKEMDDFMFNFTEDNKGKENMLVARDNKHFGSAYHEYWSKFIYEKYKEKN
jgi:hypothetical protein